MPKQQPQINIDRLLRQVEHALKDSRVRNRQRRVALQEAIDVLADERRAELGTNEAIHRSIARLSQAQHRLEEILNLRARKLGAKREIVVRENGRDVRVLGKDDIVQDVLDLIEQDILGRDLGSDEAVMQAASDWLTILTRGISEFTREKGVK